MHAEPVGTTTASMIARLAPSPDEPLTYWASLGSPCLSAFIPLYVDADVPAVLSRGGEHPSDDSPWWQAKRILTLVEANWPERGPLVRDDLDQFEARVAAQMEHEKVTMKSPAERTAFMHDTVAELGARLTRLERTLS
jgi:dipeptidase